MNLKERKMKAQNCCANCNYTKDYTGTDDFYCKSYNCWMRAEQYNCESFKSKTDNN